MDKLEKIRKSNFHRVIYLALCYMMLFTAYSSTQLLMTQIYQQLGYEKLGQYCLFGAYLGVLLSSLVSTYYHHKISIKLEILGGAMTYVALLFCGAFASSCYKFKLEAIVCRAPFMYSLTITLAIVMGIGVSFFWLAQSTYVNACADEQTRGTLNGIFFSFLQVSQILSQIIAIFVLGEADQFAFYFVLLVLGLIALFMMCFIKAPIPYNTIYEVEQHDEHKKSLKHSLKKLMKTLREKKYYFVFMGVTFTGVATSFYSTALGTIISSTIASKPVNIINQRTGFVLLILSIAQVLAGISFGRLADKLSKLKLLGLTLIINEVGLALSVLTSYLNNYKYSFLAGVFWGFGDNGINTMLNIVIGSRFNSNPELFSCYRLLEATGCIISVVCGIFMLKTNPILYMILIAGIMIFLQAVFYYFYPRDDESSAKADEMSKESTSLGDQERGLLQNSDEMFD